MKLVKFQMEKAKRILVWFLIYTNLMVKNLKSVRDDIIYFYAFKFSEVKWNFREQTEVKNFSNC